MKRLLTTLAVSAALITSGFAQAPKSGSLLDDARRMAEVATQRAEVDLQTALREAKSANASEAVAILKRVLDRLEKNEDLIPDRKSSMLRTVKDRLRLAEQAARVSGERITDDTSKTAKTNARRAEEEKQAIEREKIRSAISGIVRLQGQKRDQEAERQARDLAMQYPDNPAARAMGRSGFLNTRVREARDLLMEQEKRLSAAMGPEMMRSATLSKDDVEFDKKRWNEINKLRKDNVLTAKEKAILTALNSPVKAEWRNTRFEDVIESLSTASNQVIVVDRRALEERNVTSDTAITFSAPRAINMRTALRKILSDQGLTYVIRDEVIYVTTPEKAREMMTTRTYYVSDLVNSGVFADGTRFHPVITAQAKMETAKMIVDMIKQSIDPLSWQGEGGAGTVTFSPLVDAIIVRQSAEVHMLLKGGLLK